LGKIEKLSGYVVDGSIKDIGITRDSYKIKFNEGMLFI